MKTYRVVLLVGLATAFSLLGDQTLYSVLPTYYTELGLLPYQVGLILSLNRGIRLLTNHLAERICRRFSLGLLFGLALAGGAVLTAVYALVPAFWVLLLARMLWGLCWSFIRQISLVTVADSAGEGKVGRWMGFYSGISRLGSITGNFVGALGHDLFGYTTVLLFFAVVSALAVPLGPFARRGLPHVESRTEEVRFSFQGGWGLLFAGFAAGCVGQGLVMSTMGLVLREEMGETLSVGHLTLGVATLTGALMASRWIADLAAPLMGGLTDRIGRRNGATLFLGAGALVLIVASLGSGVLWLVLGILLYFVCATGAWVTLVAEAGVRGPRAVAAFVTASDFGSFAGPLIGWLMPQWNLPTELIFAIGGVLYGIASWVAFYTFARKIVGETGC